MPIENNLANIASRISQYLDNSTQQTTEQLLNELTRHTDATSYSMGQELLLAIQTLDEAFLQNPEVSNDTKTLIATKLMEEIETCTPGFHNRVQKLLMTQSGIANNFSDMLKAIRHDIVERVAMNNIHHTSFDSQVHAHNDFYTVASIKYNTEAINAEDPYHGRLSTQQIERRLDAGFKENYDLFGCLTQLEDRLRSDLTTLGEYRGELGGDEAYARDSYNAFVEHLNKILEPSTPFTAPDVLTFAEDTGSITDIHWPWVRKKLYERLIEEHDFSLNPHARDLMQCFLQDSMADMYAWLNAQESSGFDYAESFEALHHLKALKFFKHWSWEKQVLWIHTYLENTEDREIQIRIPELFDALNDTNFLELLPITYDRPFFMRTYLNPSQSSHDEDDDYTILMHTVTQHHPEKFNFVMDKLKLLPPREQTYILNHAGPILQLAAQSGYPPNILKLLDRGCDIESRDPNNNTALHWAAIFGRAEVIRCLLNHGASIKAQGIQDNTALHMAIMCGHRAVVDLLLEHNAQVTTENDEDNNALELAIAHHPALIEPLLMHMVTLPLHVQKSCLFSIPCSTQDHYPNVLYYAAAKHPLLLDSLIEASTTQHPFSVDAFDIHGYNILHWAARHGHVEAVQCLLNRGASLENVGHRGNTALHLAIIHGQRAVVELLLEKNANIHSRNDENKNALDLTHEHHPEFIEPLLMQLATLSLDEQKEYLSNIPNGPYPHVLSYAAAHQPLLLDAIREKLEAHHQMPTNKLILASQSSDLFFSIRLMRDYGTTLYNQGAPKGQVVIDLAMKLQSKADVFFSHADSQPDFSIFTAEFLTLLNSENATMSEYRLSWPTILKNIAIALTGIGLVCIAGQLIYSHVTQGRPLFFFQKDKTTCEEKRDSIEQSIVELEAHSALASL